MTNKSQHGLRELCNARCFCCVFNRCGRRRLATGVGTLCLYLCYSHPQLTRSNLRAHCRVVVQTEFFSKIVRCVIEPTTKTFKKKYPTLFKYTVFDGR